MKNDTAVTKRYLVASDFDQTLSFNDSGIVLSELAGVPGFHEKVVGLSNSNLVQQGAELAYLLRHDPEFRGVRKEHLKEAGKRVRLKNNVDLLAAFFEKGLDGYGFPFYVLSASPQDVVQSALEGIVPADRIFGTKLEYDASTGEISSINRVSAGYGKVAVLQELENQAPDYARSYGLHGRQQFGPVRDAACEQSGGLHHRRLRGKVYWPHRQTDGAQRQRVERSGADSGRHSAVEFGADTRGVRIVWSVPPGMGQESH